MNPTKKIGETLVEQNIISPSQLDKALKKQKELSLPLGETLIEMEFVSENRLLKILSRHLNVEFLNISENDFQIIDRSLVHVLSVAVCRRFMVLPVFLLDDSGQKQLTLAMANPLNTDAIKEVEKLTASQVTPILTTSFAIKDGIEKLFAKESDFQAIVGDIKLDHEDETVKYVNHILVRAVRLGASDIHIEPHTGEVHLRMRIDGVLDLEDSISYSNISSIVSRLKIMGSETRSLMRIDEKRVPQDGSFARVIEGHTVDFRVSTFPTIYGEKVVLRVLDKDRSASIRHIKELKMPPTLERQYIHCVQQASGIIIATGPTGSGKSTTLYASINDINSVNINIVTLEDPVEYHADEYVNQSSIMPEAGFTYTNALPAILRQDPDVILIGEIRNLDTAEIAIHAALTGHLVFTTLHTDDAAGAVVRLVDLGIEQFLVSSTVVSAVNQRLLRKICSHCEEEYDPAMAEMIEIGIDENVAAEIIDNNKKMYIKRGRGCDACRQTGYIGRQGAYELLIVTPIIKKLILSKVTSDVIAEQARKKEDINMLFEDGLRLVLTGVTTFDELRRIPRGDYMMKSVEKIFKAAGDKSYP